MAKGNFNWVDGIKIPNGYLAEGLGTPNYNSAIDEESMTYAVLCNSVNYDVGTLVIFNFDGNHD